MKVSCQIQINASKEEVWKVITNIEKAPEHISGIKSVEVLEKPDSGVIGLKWKETREMFGKEAQETMWITDAIENSYYQTRAESHGAIYISKMAIDEENGVSTLTMSFDGKAQTAGAKIMSTLMGWMFKKGTIKAIEKDLSDIKARAEQH